MPRRIQAAHPDPNAPGIWEALMRAHANVVEKQDNTPP